MKFSFSTKLSCACIIASICVTQSVIAIPFTLPAQNPVVQFDAAPLGTTTMQLVDIGSHYVGISGGSTTGDRLVTYDKSDPSITLNYAPGVDFRSYFQVNDEFYARAFNNNQLFRQTELGTFEASSITLTGHALDSQSPVKFNHDRQQFISRLDDTVTLWNLDGSFSEDITLQNFGDIYGEDSYPKNGTIETLGDLIFTYADGIVSTWTFTGQRIFTSELIGDLNSFDSNFSFSIADEKFFVVNEQNQWLGYNSVLIPEPSSIALLLAGTTALLRRKQK